MISISPRPLAICSVVNMNVQCKLYITLYTILSLLLRHQPNVYKTEKLSINKLVHSTSVTGGRALPTPRVVLVKFLIFVLL